MSLFFFYLYLSSLFLSICSVEEEWYEAEAEWSDGAWRASEVICTIRIPPSASPHVTFQPSPVGPGESSFSPSLSSFPTHWVLHHECRGVHYTCDFHAGCFPNIFPSSRLSEPSRLPTDAQRVATGVWRHRPSVSGTPAYPSWIPPLRRR